MIASRLVNYYVTRVRLCEGFGGSTLNWGVLGPDFSSDDFVGVYFLFFKQKKKQDFLLKKLRLSKVIKGTKTFCQVYEITY